MNACIMLFVVVLVFAGNAVAQVAAMSPESIKETSPQRTPAFNPDVSAIVDTYYYRNSCDKAMGHVLSEVAGFGEAHHHEHASHEHQHGPDEGFNLRHLELEFSADVDPYFKGCAIAAIDLDNAEIEVAEIETTSLPWGLKLRGGKFYSQFGYINAQHPHEWAFADRPLIYRLALGEHGLNDIGLQLSWLAPTPFYLMAGVEAFQGDNEKLFAYYGDGPLPVHEGPRVGVGWLKMGPSLLPPHGLQFGVFAATGKHQEEHDGNADGMADHWLDGDSTFWGGDAVYKFDASKPYGEGDFILQSEYFSRRKDAKLVAHNLVPHLVGNSRVDEQDGYYVQVVYGFLPRFRVGARWEQVGLMNETELPNGETESFGTTSRGSVMLDFLPSEFSLIRLQVNRGSYAMEAERETVSEVYLQWVISLGAHGSHAF